ncbi:hypothetical protein BJX64DRAFT_259572 [Aspergillus heterothallicus]
MLAIIAIAANNAAATIPAGWIPVIALPPRPGFGKHTYVARLMDTRSSGEARQALETDKQE